MIKNPTIIYDNHSLNIIQYGEYNKMINLYDNMYEWYNDIGHKNIADNLRMIEVPNNKLLKLCINNKNILLEQIINQE